MGLVIEEIKEDMVVKERNQHASSQSSSKKSREENNRANVSASCSKLDHSLLFDNSYDFEKINGYCSSTECYLIVNSVNILNLILIDLIGKCPECNSNTRHR